MEQRVPFFDVEYAMTNYGYIHEPHTAYASFRNERTNCAVYYQALIERRPDVGEPCATKCKLCLDVATQNDYIRAKLPPRYPVPALNTAWQLVNNGEGMQAVLTEQVSRYHYRVLGLTEI